MSMSVAPPAASMPAGIGGAGPVRPKVDVFAYSNYAVTCGSLRLRRMPLFCRYQQLH